MILKISCYDAIKLIINFNINKYNNNSDRDAGWETLVKSTAFLSRQSSDSTLCKSMNEFDTMRLINAINMERTKRGLKKIPASDDMCATALFKGFVQKVIL